MTHRGYPQTLTRDPFTVIFASHENGESKITIAAERTDPQWIIDSGTGKLIRQAGAGENAVAGRADVRQTCTVELHPLKIETKEQLQAILEPSQDKYIQPVNIALIYRSDEVEKVEE